MCGIQFPNKDSNECAPSHRNISMSKKPQAVGHVSEEPCTKKLLKLVKWKNDIHVLIYTVNT